MMDRVLVTRILQKNYYKANIIQYLAALHLAIRRNKTSQHIADLLSFPFGKAQQLKKNG